jgi:hypothetical protein
VASTAITEKAKLISAAAIAMVDTMSAGQQFVEQPDESVCDFRAVPERRSVDLVAERQLGLVQ